MSDWTEGLQRAQQSDRSRPRFHFRSIQDVEKSDEAGVPIFRDVEYVEITAPGISREKPCFRVNDHHKKRWPDQYKAFKEGQEVPLDGYPIEQWPQVSRAEVDTLKSLGVRTVEDLVGAPEENIRRAGSSFLNLKYKATEFIKNHGSEQQKIAELEDENEELKKRLDKLEALVSQPLTEPQKPKMKAKAKVKGKK